MRLFSKSTAKWLSIGLILALVLSFTGTVLPVLSDGAPLVMTANASSAVGSLETSATPTPAISAPATPMLKAPLGGKGTLKVVWKKVASATGYQVQYRMKGTKEWKTRDISSSKQTLTLHGLRKGKRYQVRVRSYTQAAGAGSPADTSTHSYSDWSRSRTAWVYRALVVIDAGHQAKVNSHLEPIGPGAHSKKPKVAGGTRGVVTHKPEGKLTLEVALKLEKELKARGVKVVMIRRTQKVDIPNSKRAKIANKVHADLFIRLHADASGSASTQGISTLIPKKNKWTKPIVKKSATAGKVIHKALIKKTGAKNHGVIRRGDLSGFNWCRVPSVLVEMGFMTNPKEDRKMSTESYQKKLAQGMAAGIVKWVK